MLWHLLNSLRIPVLYDYTGAGPARGEISYAPLDQIDVAGIFNYQGLDTAAVFVRTAIQSIGDPEYFANQVLRAKLPPIEERRNHTDQKYRSHLDKLCQWRVIEQVKLEALKVVCRYFAVSKDESTSRSIFDGRNLSDMCVPPPRLRLPDPREIATYFGDFPRRTAITVWDYRHFFHQIELHPEISKYFGVKLDKRYFLWRCLAMGWSHSPSIAQALGLAMLIERNQKYLEHPEFVARNTEVPAYIAFRHEGQEARAYLTYDNVCVIGDPDLVFNTRQHAPSVQTAEPSNQGQHLDLAHRAYDAKNRANHRSSGYDARLSSQWPIHRLVAENQRSMDKES